MNENTINLIRELAAKLGTTTEYLVKVFVDKARADAIVGLVSGGVLLAFFMVVSVWLWVKSPKWHDGDAALLCRPLAFVIAFLGSCCVIGCFSECVSTLMAPEAHAIQEILRSIRR